MKQSNDAEVFKGPYANYILIPRVQPDVVLFLVSNESLYFSNYNPKISASNSLYLQKMYLFLVYQFLFSYVFS